MVSNHLTDSEIALELAHAMRKWRIAPDGAGLTQTEVAQRSGIGLTPLKRFEKTGGITLRNVIAVLRALGLLYRLDDLIPELQGPGPLAILKAERALARRARRVRAPRRPRQRGGPTSR